MQQVKPIKRKTFILVILYVVLFLLTRLPLLNYDTVNPDAINWHIRSEQFVVGLKTGDWLKTYQHYHPGVTLMWIMGPVVEILKHTSPTLKTYTSANYLFLDFASKLAVVKVQLILSLILLFALSKLLTFKKALLVVSLFTFEPFFVGNSRLLHLDVLMTLFLFNGLVFAFWTIKEFKWWKAVLTGVFLALAFLTKSIAIGGLVFVLLYGIYKRSPKFLAIILGTFILTTFALFPALWVRPVYVLTEIFSEGERIGIRSGHEQIVLGDYTTNAGFEFYPLVLLLKVSPITLIGILLFFFFALKNFKRPKEVSFELFLAIFSLGYLLVMSFPTKKIDRYVIPMFPFLALIAVDGFEKLKKYRVLIVSVLSLVFIVLPLIMFFPYYFTYTSPLFGTAENANKVVAQKLFGVGVPELRDFIIKKYGDKVDLGFYDVKPMKAIYGNSKVCDVRLCGVSDYQLLVLGINEEMPEKVTNSTTTFVLADTIKINGLDYWKIYVKQ